MSGNELAAYLRGLREAVRPGDVGLPEGPRRRTPGLRRAELATLAGISVEYLTRLEQGRDRNPSAQVLGALADVLGLSFEQRLHLRHLAKMAGGDALLCSAAASSPARTVRPTLRALLDRLEPAPAVLLNRLEDVLAHTAGYALMVAALGVLDDDRPNLARYVFTDPRARAAFPEWGAVAAGRATALRLAAAMGDGRAGHLVEELTITAGAVFTELLHAPPAPPATPYRERLAHPGAGELRLVVESLDLADADQRLVVYLPADETTAAALDHLTGRQPGALHAVTA
ncbi:helix-turn-helix domain-containing protein [Nonomuraea sp. C10]|uniref:helix-turn-helix domain-containing protein n=1 Tax=Nonomuraea sp. C10 TaxID=2600577 RepID=UPI0011CE32B2|nr:helix-turn-helix domain-containing protein [Nonomuraea sp. C10]TXK41300.1 helix-turn-helix transcriptional regulator [Nonomuraea sp. C10]